MISLFLLRGELLLTEGKTSWLEDGSLSLETAVRGLSGWGVDLFVEFAGDGGIRVEFTRIGCTAEGNRCAITWARL